MSRFRSFAAMQSYIGAQSRDGERDDAGGPAPAVPFVTVSRQAGAGGTTVAEHLAEILNVEHEEVPWTVFDKGLVQRVIDDHDLPSSFERLIREESVSEIQAIVEELFGTETGRRGLVRMTSRTVLHLASLGHVILVGRAANIVTRGLPGGLHVRLVGSVHRRVRRVMEFYGLSKEQADESMRRKDGGRKGYLRRYFKRNIEDASLYDLIVNTDRFSYEEAATLIASALGLQAKRT